MRRKGLKCRNKIQWRRMGTKMMKKEENVGRKEEVAEVEGGRGRKKKIKK
jgi:hypothetical protein